MEGEGSRKERESGRVRGAGRRKGECEGERDREKPCQGVNRREGHRGRNKNWKGVEGGRVGRREAREAW